MKKGLKKYKKMGTGGSVNKENKTLNENKEKDKKLERDYIPQNLIIGEKR